MGRLQTAIDFILARDVHTPRIEVRDALGPMPVQWQVGKPSYPVRNPDTYDHDAYRKLALIFRCINVLATAVSSAPVKVYQEAEQQAQELPNHPLRRLMKRPNPLMGEARFISIVAMTVATSGFCVVEKVRSGAGRPVELWPLRSDWLYPMPRSQAAPDWEYRIPGFDRSKGEWDGRISQNGYPIIDARDAIVATFADTPDGSYTGIGPLEVALREWGLLNTMQDFLKAFFDGGAMPTYGLVLADGVVLDEKKAALVKELWAGKYSGIRRDPKDVPILQTIKDVKRLSFDYNELAYVDLRDVSEIAICTAFGVPGSMVGQRFAQERNTFTNYGEARQSFYEDTIVPLWARLDDALSFGLLAEFESNPLVSLQFDTTDVPALQEDVNAKWLRAQGALTASGLTVNEFRREVGLPAVANGDVFLRPFNAVEVPAGNVSTARASVTVSDNAQVRALPDPDMERRTRGLVPIEQRSAIEERANRLYSHAAATYGPRIALFFRAQGRRLTALLERSEGALLETRDVADLLQLDWSQEDEELDRLIRQLWDLMGQSAAGDVTALLGSEIAWDIGNAWVQDVLDQVATRVTGINETTRQQIAQTVGDALDEGVSIPQLKERLTGLFEETYRGRSETIARTESQIAFNQASAASFRESGLVDRVELLDNPNHTTDPGSDGLTCAQRNGLVVALEDVGTHIEAEHPNGSLAIAPVLTTPLGEV